MDIKKENEKNEFKLKYDNLLKEHNNLLKLQKRRYNTLYYKYKLVLYLSIFLFTLIVSNIIYYYYL